MAQGRRFVVHEDVLLEILSRLPAKSLGRFKMVSRRWERLISSDPYLLARAQRSTRSVLGFFSVTYHPLGGTVVYFPLDLDDVDGAPDANLGLPAHLQRRISLLSACNGLVFLRLPDLRQYLVVNPTTKYLHHLPPPRISTSDTVFGLTFYPTRSSTMLDFKVVTCTRTPRDAPEEDRMILPPHFYDFYIYSSSRADDAWRASRETVPCTDRPLLTSASSVFYSGVVHWLREGGDIVAFDVEKEKAYSMPLPQGVSLMLIAGFYSSVRLGVADGCLTLVEFKGEDMHVWVMEDYTSRRRWELKHRVQVPAGRWNPRMMAPVFYDGEKCVFFAWKRQQVPCGLVVYRVTSGLCNEIKPLSFWMGSFQQFLPHVACWLS